MKLLQKVKQSISYKLIKILAIGYVTVINMFIALFCAKVTDKYSRKIKLNKNKLFLTIEIILMIWIYGVMIYVVRNIVKIIPFPFDGYYGFNHSTLKELNSSYIFTFVYIIFCGYFKNKLYYYYKNVITL